MHAAFNWVQILLLTQLPGSVFSSTPLCPESKRRMSKFQICPKSGKLIDVSAKRRQLQINKNMLQEWAQPCSQAAWAGSCRWRLWGSSPALFLHSGCKMVGPGPDVESSEIQPWNTEIQPWSLRGVGGNSLWQIWVVSSSGSVAEIGVKIQIIKTLCYTSSRPVTTAQKAWMVGWPASYPPE